MTYPPTPVNQPTFVVITSAGLLSLLAAAVLALLQPIEFAQSVTAAQTMDVITTGTVVQAEAGPRECTDLIRTDEGAQSSVLLAPASD